VPGVKGGKRVEVMIAERRPEMTAAREKEMLVSNGSDATAYFLISMFSLLRCLF
jgi:hypothetical protein